jgi:hypothetical protein
MMTLDCASATLDIIANAASDDKIERITILISFLHRFSVAGTIKQRAGPEKPATPSQA